MSFGQQSGPPAHGKKIDELLDLLLQLGFSGFKEARHPFGLSQRQAGGKFSIAEADDLAERLTAEIEGAALGEAPHDSSASPQPKAVPKQSALVDRRATERQRLLKKIPDQLLAAELQSRGWVVMEP